MAADWKLASREAVFGRPLDVSARALWAIFWLGAGSFVPLLFLQYSGEEGVYPIAAQEMQATGELIRATMYGEPLGRPGLYAWLIAGLSDLLGHQHILIAARLIAASSTVLIGLMLAWLVRRLFNDRLLAAFAAAVFLSGDVLLQRGWHAYVDPLFSLITFAAMACLWIAVEERRRTFLLLAMLGLSGSFLAKALTGYVFYGFLGLVLIWRHRNRGFLFTPSSILLHAAALAFPLLWNYAIAGDSVIWAMIGQVVFNAKNDTPPSAAAFAALFVVYPLRTFFYLAPASVIVVYSLLSRRIAPAAFRQNAVLIALLTAAINMLPYWLAPGSSARYLMPIYPFFALVMAYAIRNSGKLVIDLAAKALIATVAFAYAAALIGFPAYEYYFRGNYDNATRAIIARAGDAPIFVTDDSAIGLSIVADINARRAPLFVTRPPAGFASGLVLSAHPDPAIGPADMTFTVGRDPSGKRTRYLLCRGDPCSGTGRPPAGPLVF
jgi:4-amino-4-deoxy-L-arabinose transferase-like glycosyltransferase